MKTKICSKCGEDKPLEEYYKEVACKDGRRPDCKECNNFKSKKYNSKNSQNIKASKKSYYKINIEEKLDWQKQYYELNKSIILDYQKQQYNFNKEPKLEYQKQYYDLNKYKVAEQHKEYRKTNKQKISEYQEQYYSSNKEKIYKQKRQYLKSEMGKAAKARAGHNRRTKEKDTTNDLSAIQWNIILQLQNYQCIGEVCGHKYFYEVDPTRDHIVPVENGGGLTFNNVQALCPSCNSKKHTKTIDYRSPIHKQTIANL